MRSAFATSVVAILLSLGAARADAQEVLRDPTRPFYAQAVSAVPGGGTGNATSFDVTAIFTSDLRRVAVINGQRVLEGDRVDGATVVEILADRLRLNVHGKVITSRVLPYGFRK